MTWFEEIFEEYEDSKKTARLMQTFLFILDSVEGILLYGLL